MVTFKIKIADKVIEINAFNETTKKYCSNFIVEDNPDFNIAMTQEDLDNERTESSTGKVYVNEEISALYRRIANVFVEENIAVLHGSSFKVGGYAFLVAAKSGTGKSTHVNLLNQLLKDEFEYINDDKPLLKVNENELRLYSSPWNGKEKRGNNISAPLKAIIFLNRGITNSYRKLDNKEEVYFRLLNQIYLPKEKSKRENALKIMDIILKRINFYEINVNMDISSAEMTYERIIKNEIK